ncbi:probable cyclin-dependent serine/threonine-protein kinase DDB_G0292550 [Oppia nitens]|uniref:probable cyclin-dependent serine/threonine-protein kinase DDB_G0292550 n=1 Tax=Oppia nitens TaxID=1686743 RepID=UPI0023DB7E48|nr:probable cyclin-dependent serine/threonine-protein kinase DDB_G0292550 [Oppia nitens]
MPDNEINDNINKRPKRRASQRTYIAYENASIWSSEDKDLKKALLASLQDVKKNTSNAKKSFNKKTSVINSSYNNCQQNSTKDNDSSIVADNNCGLLSNDNNNDNNAVNRKAKVSAQRKFAQSSGYTTTSPVVTPVKTAFVTNNNVIELLPNQKPNTEDFLTFLCLRRSSILPENLDFFRFNGSQTENNEKKFILHSSDEETEDNDKSVQNINCRIKPCLDRRESTSSNVSKTNSFSSKASVQVFNTKKSEQKTSNKSQTLNNNKNNNKCVVIDNSNQNNCKKISNKINKSNAKSILSLKEKYKQQRIEKNSLNPSKTVNAIIVKSDVKNIKDNKIKENRLETERIQTRQMRNNLCKQVSDEILDTKMVIKKDMFKEVNSSSSGRVLRSHHSSHSPHVLNRLLSKVSNNLMIRKQQNIKTKKCLNSSQRAINLKKRKARPVVPLIDYYFDSEFESDSDKKDNKSNRKGKLLNSTQNKTLSKYNLKNNSNKTKLKFNAKHVSYNQKDTQNALKLSKSLVKSGQNSKTSLKTDTRRQTRSFRSISPIKDKQLEREMQIKKQIIEIEKKHKRLRRCPSDESLHSSTSTSSSSSESLPNSFSSSSSINKTRLTRSLEHLKKIRDIAAKLKRDNNNKQNKNKNNSKTDNSKNTKPKTNGKQNVNKSKQEIQKTKRNGNCDKNSKYVSIINNNNKSLKPVKKLTKRVINNKNKRRKSERSDTTDCDTEGNDLMSEMNTEDSMASIYDEDMERASIVIQDMADDMNTHLVDTSEPDLQYGSTEHIQGLMTCEFSGAFSDETVTTASAILLPQDFQHSQYNYNQTDDTHIRSTVDASTNTTEDDIFKSDSEYESEDDIQTSLIYESNCQTLSVGTQTIVNTSVQTDGLLD